jgi:hypothetical protein
MQRPGSSPYGVAWFHHPDRSYDTWPDCLGPWRYDLPPAMQEVIRQGEEVFTRLMIRLSTTPTTAPKTREALNQWGATKSPAEPAAHQSGTGNKQPEALAPPIILGGEDDDPVVCGRTKERLTPAQYRVVKTLLDAFPERLSGDNLARKSNVEDPIGVIDRLCRDEDWAAVLFKPGKAHGGYGINARPRMPRKTEKNRETRPRKPRG